MLVKGLRACEYVNFYIMEPVVLSCHLPVTDYHFINFK